MAIEQEFRTERVIQWKPVIERWKLDVPEDGSPPRAELGFAEIPGEGFLGARVSFEDQAGILDGIQAGTHRVMVVVERKVES